MRWPKNLFLRVLTTEKMMHPESVQWAITNAHVQSWIIQVDGQEFACRRREIDLGAVQRAGICEGGGQNDGHV